tara:strand:- start:9319 stop:9606 length:288 start_codon:yes stop_codon:yes gene_type:complete
MAGLNPRSDAAKNLMVQYGAPPPEAPNKLTGFLKQAGSAALGAGVGGISGAIGSKVGDWASGLFNPRNPAMMAAAQHPKNSLAADRAWSMAGGGE